MHVDGEGGDESEAKVVTKRPGVGVGAKVPADQRAVDSGVRQHGLSARVEMMDVDRTAVLLEVQRPEKSQGHERRMSQVTSPTSAQRVLPVDVLGSPGLEGLDFGGFWRFIGFDCQQLDGSVV